MNQNAYLGAQGMRCGWKAIGLVLTINLSNQFKSKLDTILMCAYVHTLVRPRMARLNVTIDDELEKRLRVEVAKRGGKKGDLAKAVQEGIELWLKGVYS